MFEEFEEFLRSAAEKAEETEQLEQLEEPEDLELPSDVFHVEADDPENPRVVGGVPELWAETLDSQQGDNVLGMGGDCGLVSVCNVERMAGIQEASEDSVCVEALRTGNCAFSPFDIEGSGGADGYELEELLERQGIPATVMGNWEMGDYGQLAELVENGHGVIMGHCDWLSTDYKDMHVAWEDTKQAFPELADAVEQGAVFTISDSGVDIQTAQGTTEHLSLEEFAEQAPESFLHYSPGQTVTVSAEDTRFFYSREAMEQQVQVDEYGRIAANHAVVITGTEYDLDGHLLGFDICDSGAGMARAFVSLEHMDACYKNVDGGVLVVTDNPIHHNGTPLRAA